MKFLHLLETVKSQLSTRSSINESLPPVSRLVSRPDTKRQNAKAKYEKNGLLSPVSSAFRRKISRSGKATGKKKRRRSTHFSRLSLSPGPFSRTLENPMVSYFDERGTLSFRIPRRKEIQSSRKRRSSRQD